MLIPHQIVAPPADIGDDEAEHDQGHGGDEEDAPAHLHPPVLIRPVLAVRMSVPDKKSINIFLD